MGIGICDLTKGSERWKLSLVETSERNGVGALEHSTNQVSVNRLALSATVHCLTGCSIGEVLGMVIASALRWDNMASVTVAAALAYAFNDLF